MSWHYHKGPYVLYVVGWYEIYDNCAQMIYIYDYRNSIAWCLWT